MNYFTSKNYYKMLYINYLSKKKSSLFFLLSFIFFINLFFIPFSFVSFGQSDSTTTTDFVAVIDSTSLDSSLVLDSSSMIKKIPTKFSIGLRGGITNGQFEIANPEQNDKNTSSIGSVFTLFMNYKLNSNFSIQPELAIGRYKSNNMLYKIAFAQGTIDYVISTFDFNLIGLYSYSITDKLSISAEAGLSAAYLNQSFGEVIANNTRLGGIYTVNSDNQFEKLNYGAVVGINPSFKFKSILFQASVRYRYGLNNINTFNYELNRYLANPERTIQTRDILFQIGILVPIYKKTKNEEIGIRD